MTFKQYINNNNITKDVTELNLNNKGITNLNGIEEFTNLEYLYLTDNKISDISNLNLTNAFFLVNSYGNPTTVVHYTNSVPF